MQILQIYLYKYEEQKQITMHLFQPKTPTFSTRALIWVHFKTVHYFSQPIFHLFTNLNSALHNLVIELCSALKIFRKKLRLFSKVKRSFVAIELLTFFKNAKFHSYSSRELSVFWLNKLYSLSRTGSIIILSSLFIKTNWL